MYVTFVYPYLRNLMLHLQAHTLARHSTKVLVFHLICLSDTPVGVLAGDVVICPWHAAHFSVKTGEVIGAPALDGLPVYPSMTRVAYV